MKLFYSIIFVSFLCACMEKTTATASENKENTVNETDTFQPKANQLPDRKHHSATQPETISMAFCGDMMMGTIVPEEIHAITRDRGKSLLNDCREIFKRADVAIGNLEGACYDGDKGKVIKDITKKNCYVFRMPGDHAQLFSEAGFDFLNVANNHSNDYGPEGRKETYKTIHAQEIEITGLRGICEGAVVDRKGVRVGYVSFASSCRDCLDMNNYAEVKRVIKDWRPKCDILVVGFHGGAEGGGATHVTRQRETFLGENRGNVYEFSHLCIDLGADIVVGHGPHVPRAIELYKNHLIAYSLGNFCTPFRVNLAGISGHAPLLEATLNTSDGTFSSGKITSFIQRAGAGPRLDTKNTVAHEMQSLTKQDFPDTPIYIDNNGEVKKKSSPTIPQ